MQADDLDLSGRVVADIDPRLLRFLREKVSSFVKWDLIRFFHENPHTTDTAYNIARYTGRNVELVDSELAELAQDGVLEANQLGEMTVYSLVPDAEVRELMKQFMEASDDRHFRVKLIYHIIRGMDR